MLLGMKNLINLKIGGQYLHSCMFLYAHLIETCMIELSVIPQTVLYASLHHPAWPSKYTGFVTPQNH